MDHHPCSRFLPHFSWFQLPAMSSYSAPPCQIKARQYFLPMKMIICCNQIISQSSFWLEKQIEVIWSRKVIVSLFPVSNHFSASFLNLLRLFSSPFKNKGARCVCSTPGLASLRLHTGRKLPAYFSGTCIWRLCKSLRAGSGCQGAVCGCTHVSGHV